MGLGPDLGRTLAQRVIGRVHPKLRQLALQGRAILVVQGQGRDIGRPLDAGQGQIGPVARQVRRAVGVSGRSPGRGLAARRKRRQRAQRQPKAGQCADQ